MENVVLIKLKAGHDTNGNPRRCYVAIDLDGAIVGAWDEGYRGRGAVPPELGSKAIKAPEFRTTPGEYREILKKYEQ